MPSPENQHCEGGPYDFPPRIRTQASPPRPDLRQDRRPITNPKLEQEERERRADDQAALTLRRMYDLTATTRTRAENIVQRGEACHAAEHGKSPKRSPTMTSTRRSTPRYGAHH